MVAAQSSSSKLVEAAKSEKVVCGKLGLEQARALSGGIIVLRCQEEESKKSRRENKVGELSNPVRLLKGICLHYLCFESAAV